MNLLFVTRKNPYGADAVGGAETSIRLIAAEMAKAGHRVFHVVADESAETRARAAEAGVALRAFSDPLFRRLPGPAAKALEIAGLAAFMVSRRIDLAYCYYEPGICERLLLARLGRRAPKIVVRIAGQYWFEQSRDEPAYRRRFERIFANADALHFVHPALRTATDEQMASLGMTRGYRRFFTGDIGSLAPLKPARRAAASDDFHLVMATRFSRYQKRQDVLVQALALIPEGERVRATFVGGGETRPQIEAMARDLGLAGRVTFVDFLPQDALWRLLDSADLLAHATDYEGVSKIVLESMSIGLPVLASNVAPLNADIEDGVNGFLVDNEPAAWAEKIRALRRTPDQLTVAAAGAAAYVSRCFQPEQNARVFEAAFRDVLDDAVSMRKEEA